MYIANLHLLAANRKLNSTYLTVSFMFFLQSRQLADELKKIPQISCVWTFLCLLWTVMLFKVILLMYKSDILLLWYILQLMCQC